MRRRLVAGNWKMNMLLSEARELAGVITKGMKGNLGDQNGVEIILAPPYLALPAIAEIVAGTEIGIAGQDCFHEMVGAFTGEISPTMLKDAGANSVILGHSERRQILGEDNTLVGLKTAAAHGAGLRPILCLGESLSIREEDKTLEHIDSQLSESLFAFFQSVPSGLILAYEPIWAIGTGLTASPEQAQEVHAFIRAQVGKKYGVDWAARTRILYGGSMKPGNAAEIFAQPDVDGGLIGGASLKSEDFLSIIRSAIKT